MTRLRLILPERLPFSTRMEVRVSDINYAGHLGNDAVLAFIHEARIRYLRSLGFTELDIEGVGIIMTEAQIVYRAEAFHGDELTVELGVGELSSHGCAFFYQLRTNSGAEVAQARTGMAFFDYDKRTVVPVPSGFRACIEVVNPAPGA